MMRAKKRRARRRGRALRRNPLSRNQKLLMLGGVVAVGGVAAWVLTGDSTPPVTAPPPGAAGAALANQCSALEAQIGQLLARPTPDAAEIQRLQTNLSECIRQARAAGGAIDNSTSQRATGDDGYNYINGKFGEYKATDVIDPLRRNNIRQEMLRAGEAMASAYQAAVTQAASNDAALIARVSILKALESAIARKLCYRFDMPGCGRSGVSEDHGNDKAAQEQSRVIAPLLTAHAAVEQKFGGRAALAFHAVGNDLHVRALTAAGTAMNDYVGAKFAEYKTVDYADALRRNNIRVGEILDVSRMMVANFRDAVAAAKGYGYVAGARGVSAAINAAVAASTVRWLCFLFQEPGCGTFAANEDQPDVKARQEFDTTLRPLTELLVEINTFLVARGDVNAFEPLIATKLGACTTLSSYVNSKFAEYKSISGIDGTGSDDPLRRNNLRQVVLGFGRILVSQLEASMNIATAAGKIVPAGVYTAQVVAALSRSAPMLLNINLSPAPTAGLGQSLMLAMPLTAPATASVAGPTAAEQQAAAARAAVRAAGVVLVQRVMAVAIAALGDAVTRALCFYGNEPGCRTFGANEDQPNVKADQERAATVTPLIGICASGAKFLADSGIANAEVPLISQMLRFCTASKTYIDSKFAELKSVPYHDPVRRNNIRGVIISEGRGLVTCLRNIKPATPAGKQVLRGAIESALAASRTRRDCYAAAADGCNRSGDFEPLHTAKAAEESAAITAPLEALLTGGGLSGLLDDSYAGLSGYAWLGLGAVAVIGLVAYQSKGVRRNRRRRSSRRPRLTA